LSGLFDFFQSASNAVADNVAGPVDLINSGLGLFGLRSKEPIGGSEWMKRWGLKRDVEMGGARLAGETAGLLSPALLAAKAPQIAKGLLQAQENAAIPRQMHPEMGAIVYHGSPHKFDKFDSSKIGTGEGVQAYGHGLYLADDPAIASHYRDALDPGPTLNNWTVGSSNLVRNGEYSNYSPRGTSNMDSARATLAEHLLINEREILEALRTGGKEAAKAKTLEVIDGVVKMYANEPAYKIPMSVLRKSAERQVIDFTPSQASLYKVDLPDEAIAKMLDWDKPLSQQAPEVQAAVQKLGIKGTIPRDTTWGGPASREMVGREIYAELDRAGKLLHNPETANAFRGAGIPGIRYLDGGSRGAGTGTSNYVVFPGEEHLLKILERNGGLMGP
jgi:hypothetical protein